MKSIRLVGAPAARSEDRSQLLGYGVGGAENALDRGEGALDELLRLGVSPLTTHNTQHTTQGASKQGKVSRTAQSWR